MLHIHTKLAKVLRDRTQDLVCMTKGRTVSFALKTRRKEDWVVVGRIVTF
jgi:hypothetical protein